MDEYKMPCIILWNGCTEAIKALEKQNFREAVDILRNAQREAENCCITDVEDEYCQNS